MATEPSWKRQTPNGAAVLDGVEALLARFVAYPSEHARVAHTLWIAHAHRMDAWESTPRIAFLSPEPGSGKTRALEITELLVPRPVLAVNTTPAYLFRKVADEAGPPTLLYDEIDTLFGPRAKENEDVRGMLNAGHRKGAVAGRCVVRGKTIETEELPAYCAVALAGLDDLPDTLMSRSVVVRMRRRAPSEAVDPFRRRECLSETTSALHCLSEWAEQIPTGAWPQMPSGIADRDADVWEALLIVADTAGGSWPDRARRAAVALVADAKAAVPSLGVRLLADLRTVFGDRERMSTEEIISSLTALDESPWGDLRGKPLDARGLARRLARYQIKPKSVRIGGLTPKGYARDDLADSWARYVAPPEGRALHSSRGSEEESAAPGEPAKGSATSATPPRQATGGDTVALSPDWALPPEAFDEDEAHAADPMAEADGVEAHATATTTEFDL